MPCVRNHTGLFRIGKNQEWVQKPQRIETTLATYHLLFLSQLPSWVTENQPDQPTRSVEEGMATRAAVPGWTLQNASAPLTQCCNLQQLYFLLPSLYVTLLRLVLHPSPAALVAVICAGLTLRLQRPRSGCLQDGSL